ncbi:PREDICTED: putative uncharacterized protein DDB_G0277255 [Lupinus angustifolius]|uniref:putative uncharacterized protein DDB_G0277255 n=1 Tax=Lupinus angustifolius TaxID=3871 RepID=UPI00092F8CEC|nr:PREDICTED: putative uncharacterized protein DDB_G0277255 [Lupinus angustifolius]
MAMDDEYNALIQNKTWDLVPRPPDANVIRSMWIFRHKEKYDGSFERHKARLVGNALLMKSEDANSSSFASPANPVRHSLNNNNNNNRGNNNNQGRNSNRGNNGKNSDRGGRSYTDGGGSGGSQNYGGGGRGQYPQWHQQFPWQQQWQQYPWAPPPCPYSSNPVQHQRTKHIEMDIHFSSPSESSTAKTNSYIQSSLSSSSSSFSKTTSVMDTESDEIQHPYQAIDTSQNPTNPYYLHSGENPGFTLVSPPLNGKNYHS